MNKDPKLKFSILPISLQNELKKFFIENKFHYTLFDVYADIESCYITQALNLYASGRIKISAEAKEFLFSYLLSSNEN